MAANVVIGRAADAAQLAVRAAADVAAALDDALAARDLALLAVSGGRSPLGLYRALRAQDRGWPKVTVVQVDERCVPPDHPDSNAALVADHLLRDAAAAARWVPFFDTLPEAPDRPDAAERLAAAACARLAPLGVMLLNALKLKLSLQVAGFDARFHAYDWRLGIEHLALELNARIAADGGRDVLLVGHSMGGAVALACALRSHGGPKGLVLSAPALAPGQAVPSLKAAVLRLLSKFSPDTGALTLPAAAVSRDPAVVRAYEADPLVYRGAVPARTLVELLDAMAAFPDAVPKLKVPVFVQHGTADSLVPLAATRPLYERLGAPKLRTVRMYERLYHEVYNEPERERVLEDLEAWLESQH